MIKILWRGIYISAIYAVIVAATLIASIVAEFWSDEQLYFSFCLTKTCVNVVATHFKDTLELYKSLFYMIVPLAGLFAGIVGLNNYTLAISNSVMNNHISNFKLFCDFVDREIGKRDLIDNDCIDYYIMYSIIFPNSKAGKFNNFKVYNEKFSEINRVVMSSNDEYSKSSGKACVKRTPFNYTYHQYEIKQIFLNMGINISINHRNTFNEVENQVIELLDVISKAFVDNDNYVKIKGRDYL